MDNPFESPTTPPEIQRGNPLGYIGLSAGILAYAGAALSMGSIQAEILADAGNGIMLSTAVLLLIGQSKRA